MNNLLQQEKAMLEEWSRLSWESRKNPSIDNKQTISELEYKLFMLRNQFQSEIFQLVGLLNYYSKKYNEGSPVITDEAYDNFYFDLAELERRSGLILEDSPTKAKNIPKILEKIEVINYPYKKTFFKETMNPKEVIDFCNKTPVTAMVEPEGVKCFLHYNNGYLVTAVTEGENNTGNNIINHVLALAPQIPRRIKYKKELILEGVFTYNLNQLSADFFKNNKSIEDYIFQKITSLNIEDIINANLQFFVIDVIKGFENYTTSFRKKIVYLYEEGFIFPARNWYLNIIDRSIIEILRQEGDGYGIFFKKARFRVNEIQENTHSLQVISYIYHSTNNFSRTIKNLSYNFTLDNEGFLIPSIRFDTITFDSLNFRHAYLFLGKNDLEELLSKTPWKGQPINVYKINTNFLPQVNGADKETLPKNSKDIFLPLENCPYCGEKLVLEGYSYLNKEFLFYCCKNENCEGKFTNKIKHFVGEEGLNISGLSNEILSWLIEEKKWITSFKDIYTLKRYKKEWYIEDGFNKETVDQLLESIEESKDCSLEKFLSALPIPTITKEDAFAIAEYFQSYERFSYMIYFNEENKELLLQIPGLNEEKIEALFNFDYTEFDYLWKVFKYGVTLPILPYYFNMPLRKQTYVVVGPVKYFDSVEWLCGYIHGEGGAVVTEVTEDVDYVINNDPESNCPENIAARELDIPIITEEEFLSNIY